MRGMIQFFLKIEEIEKAQDKLKEENSKNYRKRGAQKKYSDEYIIIILEVMEWIRFRFRQTEGFIRSIMKLLEKCIPIPSYSTLCEKRQEFANLGLNFTPCKEGEVRDTSLDGSGFWFHMQNRYCAMKYKKKDEREEKPSDKEKDEAKALRRKRLGRLTAVTDNCSKEILAITFTCYDIGETAVFKELCDQIPGQIRNIHGDGGFDAFECRKVVHDLGGICVIPPRSNAIIHEETEEFRRVYKERNEAVRFMEERKKEGMNPGQARDAWKKSCNYHDRSCAENTFFRMKLTFGEAVMAKIPNSRQATMKLRGRLINKFTQIGMPMPRTEEPYFKYFLK